MRSIDDRPHSDDGATVRGQFAHIDLAVLEPAVRARPELESVMRRERIEKRLVVIRAQEPAPSLGM